MRKGQLETAGLLIEIAVLLVGSFTIGSFIHSFWRPHEQISAANSAAVQAAFNQVCSDGQAKTINFDFPQPQPAYVEAPIFGTVGQTVLPKFMIRVNGDPNFLLYYESFPLAEAVRWEVYIDYPKWGLVPIYGISPEIPNADELLQREEAAWKAAEGTETVVFPNVILGAGPLEGNSGNWSGNFYKFVNYHQLSPFKKTIIKYRACGADSLCFKTTQGIARLPLEACKSAGVSHIQIEDTKGESESSDFFFASPCKAKLEIQKTKCECRDHTLVSDTLAGTKYPLWEYRDGNLVRVAEDRLRCWHHASGTPDKTEPNADENCLYVKVTAESGACRPPAGNIATGEIGYKFPLLSYSQDRTRPDGTHYAVHKSSQESSDLKPEFISGNWAWPSGV